MQYETLFSNVLILYQSPPSTSPDPLPSLTSYRALVQRRQKHRTSTDGIYHHLKTSFQFLFEVFSRPNSFLLWKPVYLANCYHILHLRSSMTQHYASLSFSLSLFISQGPLPQHTAPHKTTRCLLPWGGKHPPSVTCATLTDWVRVLHPTRHKIGHFRDVP